MSSLSQGYNNSVQANKENYANLKYNFEKNQVKPTDILDWTSRPNGVVNKIDNIFQDLVDKYNLYGHRWIFYGAETYGMCGVDEHQLMKQLIKDSPYQRDFYVIDMGAGDFTWGKSLSKFLNAQEDLQRDITIHIIGTRAEPYHFDSEYIDGKCQLHHLDMFKMECLESEFTKKGFYLREKVDLIVTKMALQHCVDSLGTFAQSFHLLRPKSGIMIFDGFKYAIQGDSGSKEDITPLLIDMQVPFLTSDQHGFIMRRAEMNISSFPMKYTGTVYESDYNRITEFFRYAPLKTPTNCPKGTELMGDKDLYQWLKQNQLLTNNFKWMPLK